MVLSYIPLGLNATCDYLRINKKKYVTPYLYEKFDFYIEDKYCKYVLTRGKNKGYICGRKCNEGYCKIHAKNKKIDKMENNFIYCSGKSVRNNHCKRIVKHKGELCLYHNKIYKNEISETVKIQKNKNPLLLFKILIKIVMLYNSTRKEKIKFDLDKIRNISLINLLNLLNISYSIEGSTIRTYNNIIITDNKYYDNTKNCGGYGAIDFYSYITKKDIKTTISELNKFILSFPSSKLINKNNNSENSKNINSLSKMKIEDIKEDIGKIKLIKDYLIKKRKLDDKLVNLFIEKNMISSDNKNNCIFYNNDKTYLQLKGIGNKKFISSLGKSDFIEYKNADEPLYLFESPIDALSFITKHECNIDGNFVSTNGSMMINRIDLLIKKYDINKIFLCFDNDKQGELFCESVKENLKKYKINIIRIKSKYKDWNEDLQKQ